MTAQYEIGIDNSNGRPSIGTWGAESVFTTQRQREAAEGGRGGGA